MSLISGSSSAEIPAGIDAVWAVAADIERGPEWQRGLEDVTVVERDAEGRPLICDTVTDATFTKVRCRVRFSYEPPHRVMFERIAGDARELRGSWQLEDLGDGRTRATYELAVDPGRGGLMAKPLERALRPLVVGGRPEELAGEVAARARGAG